MPSTPPPSDRTLFVGDVHGCAEEFGQLLDQVQPGRVVLVGDLFTKGPDPTGVWELIREHGCEAVRGNHDQRVLDHPDRVVLPQEARRWLAGRPLFLLELGLTVVHAGVHPTLGVAGTTTAMALSMRFWPPGSERHWYEDYAGTSTVVFGHDARQGLVRRERIVGLDSGCVYGGKLTGWLREEDRLFSVPAARVYCPVSSINTRAALT